jgi:two-component system, cell cycle response regulator DivK
VVRPHVLVVEDNVKNLKLVKDVLEFAGLDVSEATSGEEGVDLARRLRPDIVLLDLQLPGIDGMEALRQIRADPATSALPVVAVTAFAMKSDRHRTLGAGFDGYIAKPISVRDFPDQVRSFLQTKSIP